MTLIMDNQLPQTPSESPVEPVAESSSKKTPFILGIILLIILAGLYFVYSYFFVSFKTVKTLSYNTKQAVELLKDPETFTYTREGKLFIGNLSGEELLLVEALDINKKIASLKVSKSRKYIVWQAEKNIFAVDVAGGKMFAIYSGPRQAFDLSPREDKLLFIRNNQLVEVSLQNGFIHRVLTSLPTLQNPKIMLNHTKYAPNGQLTYLRSIYNGNPVGKKEFIVDIKTGKVTLLPDALAEPIGLVPMWLQNSSQVLAARDNGLTRYTVVGNNSNTTVTSNKTTKGAFGPYNTDILNGTTVFVLAKTLVSSSPSGDQFINPEVILVNQSGNQTSLIKSNDPRLGKNGSISDVGFLNTDQVWFTVDHQYLGRDIWVISKDGDGLKKLIENIDKHSLDSARMPLYEIII